MASKQYCIPRTTLTRHLRNKVSHTGQAKLGNFVPTFSPEIENELVSYLKEMQLRFFGLTKDAICSLAYEYTVTNNIKNRFNINKKKAGSDWFNCFLKRHLELSLRQLEVIFLSRATGFNQVQVVKFYNNLKQLKTEKNIPVARIYNVDESGISTVTKATNQIVASKGMKQVGKLTSSERGKIITIICAMNAQENFIPPFFIFPCKRLVPALLYGASHGAKDITSSSGRTDGKIFQAWLQHFQAIVNSSIDEKVMLILDNYSSHLYLPAINFARKHGIEILSISPHTSHKLQSLDLTFFGPLKHITVKRLISGWWTTLESV